MWVLIRAELKRVWVRPLLRRTLVIGSVVVVLIALASNTESDPMAGASMGASLRFLVPVVAVVLAATAVGSWCSSGTEQLLCQWTGTRGRLFVAEILASALASTTVVLTLFVEVTAALAVRAAIQGASVGAQLEPLGTRSLALVVACFLGAAFGAGLGLLTRSSGAALGVIALFYVVLEPIVIASGRSAHVPALLYPPVSSLGAAAAMRAADIGQVSSPDVALVVSVGWVALVLATAAHRALRRDLS